MSILNGKPQPEILSMALLSHLQSNELAGMDVSEEIQAIAATSVGREDELLNTLIFSSDEYRRLIIEVIEAYPSEKLSIVIRQRLFEQETNVSDLRLGFIAFDCNLYLNYKKEVRDLFVKYPEHMTKSWLAMLAAFNDPDDCGTLAKYGKQLRLDSFSSQYIQALSSCQ